MKGGILIIGSLFWDLNQGEHNGVREHWRKKRLDMNRKIHVFAPIRYGRQSRESKSYTMVFSKDIEATGNLGTAFVIPFKNNPVTFKGLFNEAQYLSEAEGVNDKKLVKGNREKWCIIGILFNSTFDQERKNTVLSKFANQLNIDGIANHYKDFKVGEESSILNENGEIDIEWPKTVNPQNQKKLEELDFVIATCPCPNVSRYPNVTEIRNALKDDARNYFYNNIQFGITTFQDREINTPTPN